MRDATWRIGTGALVTWVLVIASFAVLRTVFPAPALTSSHCPASLGGAAYTECVAEWGEQVAARDAHQVRLGLGVALLSLGGLVLLARRPSLVPTLSVPVTLWLAAGAVTGHFLLSAFWETEPGALLVAGLLLVAAALARGEEPWHERFAALAVGVVLYFASFWTWITFFWRGD